MDILTAMKKCEIGGHVSRKAYPNRMYFKDEAGIFPGAPLVDHIDFIAQDWEDHSPAGNGNSLPFTEQWTGT